MRDIEQLIDSALEEEERALLRSIGDDPGFLAQVLTIFRGPAGWVGVAMVFVQSALFIAGAVTAWQFFEASDILTAIRWGLPSAVLLISSLTIKLSMMPTIQANRILRELKRLEWQLSRGGDAS